MKPGESLWMRAVGENGRILSWKAHSCPKGSNLGAVSVAAEVVEAAATVGIWYELRQMRKTGESELELKSAQFEERRHHWIAMALEAWKLAHSESCGLDFPATIALRKELVKSMRALAETPKMDVPEVLLLEAQDIQRQLSPRVEMAFSVADRYRQYTESLVVDGKASPSVVLSDKIRYMPGQVRTKKWLSKWSPKKAETIQSEMDEVGFWEKLFGSDYDNLKNDKSALESQIAVTKRFMPFQNLINELSNIVFVHERSQKILATVPLDKRPELFLTAVEDSPKNRGEPSNGIKGDLQRFELIAVDPVALHQWNSNSNLRKRWWKFWK